MWREEPGRHQALEEGSLPRRIDLHAGVDLEEVGQPAGVVPVPVRDDHRVEAREVDAEGLDVVGEDPRVVAGVEQDSLAVVLDERREPPVLHQLGRGTEGVIEVRDAPDFLRRGAGGKNQDSSGYCRATPGAGNTERTSIKRMVQSPAATQHTTISARPGWDSSTSCLLPEARAFTRGARQTPSGAAPRRRADLSSVAPRRKAFLSSPRPARPPPRTCRRLRHSRRRTNNPSRDDNACGAGSRRPAAS
jgi:hypothetical protein